MRVTVLWVLAPRIADVDAGDVAEVSFMSPLIYPGDQRLYPLSLGLYAFNVQAGANFGMMMGGSLLMTLPVIFIFFCARKYFIQGITLTGIKG
jgi:multiple sugar transport system permease protein